ncbi:MAG: hypothetical protein ABI620_07945 [Chloroflexota bacterium]
MADDRTAPDEAALAVVARHALHDEELVAALAADGLDDEAEIARARSFVARCTACRALHDDIVAIGAVLTMEARGTVAAPRDFRLTLEDARRLGGPVPVGGFLATLRRSIASFGRPLGASMAALGIVGLLVGSVSLGGGTAAGPLAIGSAGALATDAAATGAPAEIQAGLDGTDDPNATGRAAAAIPGASAPATEFSSEEPGDSATAGVNPALWLLAASTLLLVAGVAFLVVAIRRNP